MTQKATEKISLSKINPEELEKKIVELAKKENSPAKIGLILRDQEGIPKTKPIAKKKIAQILKENNLSHKTEKDFIQERIEKLKKHIEKNKDDHTAKRQLTKLLWALKRAV